MAYTTIDDPSAYFHTQLYTGTGSSNAITNDGNSDLQPDWIWLKDRSATNGHAVQDTSRGITNVLFTNGNDSENQYTNTVVDSVQSDGFTVSTNANSNTNTNTYVAWQWKSQGGSTVSNSDGSITSTVQANTDAGFSIVTYTGNGADTATVGHGLGATPKMIIFKRRDSTNNWIVYHNSLTSASNFLSLNTTDAEATASNIFDDTAPTSSVFTLGFSAAVNANTSTFVAYCFAEKQGFSKFGSYTGNSNADGAFVYTGFKPAFVMIKRTDSTANWHMLDNKRDPINEADATLLANDSGAEFESSNDVDFLSNGFKLRANQTSTNVGTYIYLAFAESPLVGSDGTPTTAR